MDCNIKNCNMQIAISREEYFFLKLQLFNSIIQLWDFKHSLAVFKFDIYSKEFNLKLISCSAYVQLLH